MISKQRGSIIYQRSGDSLEVRHIVGGNVQDVQYFKCNHDGDNLRLFQYVCDKLGFNFEKYTRENKKKHKFEWS